MITEALYDELNKAWGSTCRIILGEEIGGLKEYEEWLKEYVPPTNRKKSCLSDKDVYLSANDYSVGARFVSLEEIRDRAVPPLSINEIKDVDSIVRAVSEKWEYCGNKILGSSRFVEASDSVIDSQQVADSMNVQQSSHIFASANVFNNKYAFGCLRFTGNEFTIRIMRSVNSRRCFESRIILDSSDIFFSCALSGCSDLMFSFNQRNKRNCIGNLQLSKERYSELKRKLLAEVREELKEKKRFPSLFEIVLNADAKTDTRLALPGRKEEFDIRSVEKAFSSTGRILFKRELNDITAYDGWLSRHTGALKEIDSPFGSKTYFIQDAEMALYSFFPEQRIVSQYEAAALGDMNLTLDESELVDMASIMQGMHKIAYLTDELHEGKNSNISKTPAAINSSNIYKVQAAVNSENAGVCGIGILNSKCVFGCRRAIGSQFSINCYNSLNLNRCFELDSCTNCSDTYFSHNCEGLQEAMFCWNTKGKRHVIGNSQLLPDQYRQIKGSLVEQMADEIVSNGSLRYDIFNIGSGKMQ